MGNLEDMSFGELVNHIADLRLQLEDAEAELDMRRKEELPITQQSKYKKTIVITVHRNRNIDREADHIVDDFRRYGKITMAQTKGSKLYITYADHRDAEDAITDLKSRYQYEMYLT